MAIENWRPHLRQGGLFIIIGMTQVTLDTTVFVLSTALGMPIGPGNFLGRASGASLGFFLNGRYTFSDQGVARHSRRHLLRFVTAWSLLTLTSTGLLQWVASLHSLQGAWLAKPFVEATMATIGFFVWRQWVFR